MSFPKGAAALLAEKDLKGSLITKEINPLTVVGVQNILNGDSERTIMLLYNLSASELYVGFGGNVGADNGMLVPANGGFLQLNVTQDYEAVTLPIWLYSAAVNNQLYIMTTRRDTGIEE